MSSTELVAAIKTPVVLTGNFAELEAHFKKELEIYDIVVTADNVADAKKLATELNKAAAEVKSRGKAVTDEAAAPINEFNGNVKKLAQMLLDARLKLTEQVKTFEDETRQLAYNMLEQLRTELWTELNIDPDFQQAQFSDLAIISNVTAKGALAGKAKTELQNRVNLDKQMQQQTALRLANLKADSLEAGLSAPLNRGHIEHFIYADDAEYAEKLSVLIANEIQREIQIKAANEKRIAEQVELLQRQTEQAESNLKRQAEIAAEHAETQDAKHAAEIEALKNAQPEVEQVAEVKQVNVEPVAEKTTTNKFAVGPLKGANKQDFAYFTGSPADAISYLKQGAEIYGLWHESGKLVAEITIKDKDLFWS
jgi:hypothetical protein